MQAPLAYAESVLSWLEEAFIGAALAFASALLFLNVILRYVFLAPIGWAEELSLYLIVWIVFVGASVAVRTHGHIAIDLLAVSLSPANRRRLRLATGAIVLVFLAVFFYYSALHTDRVRMAGQVTPVMLAPMWLTYLAMPVGSALMFLRTCQLLQRVYRDMSETEARLELQD